MSLGPLRPASGQGWDGGRYVDYATMELVTDGGGEGGGNVDAIRFDTTWPARPDVDVVFWIGGDASTDDPSADMEVGDIWYPESE